MTQPILQIKDLKVEFPHRFGNFTAVEALSLEVAPGEIVGLIGESGAGKSTVGNAVMRLLETPGRIAEGSILLDGCDLTRLSEGEMNLIRGREIGMIFQDPMTSLNPLFRIGDQLSESIAVTQGLDNSAAWAEARRRLDEVGIPDLGTRMKQYPHEFSGGMRQRVVISLALAGNPKLLIADEPTTALDVSIQKQILNLIKETCCVRQLGVVLITHDMGVIAETTDSVLVMRYGRMVEQGATARVLGRPREDYTTKLIAAIPRIDRKTQRFVSFDTTACTHQHIDDWLKQDAKLPQDRNEHGNPLYFKADNLTKKFLIRQAFIPSRRVYFCAVDDVSMSVRRGEVMGLVGESGSGKTTLGKMIAGLTDATNGDIVFSDHGDLSNIKRQPERMAFRRDVQVIFQDPYSSLNPRLRIQKTLIEPLEFHNLAKGSEAIDIVNALLARVGLNGEDGKKYPHQFSGGQRQRICIARALALRPRFLICDEPTSALDVSIQADVLNLLKDLKDTLNLTILFVSHDLAVVRTMSDNVSVMRDGKIVEVGQCDAVFDEPQHDYTKSLLQAVPKLRYVA